ncbi:PEP-CTERM sorting domain-containing protein [Rubritalea spongiae]|uniref:PEP-CTERM sorting domain-containing protein n=1 Tax=Rubritalea spongiae TaxID=430797 RepID=A0ABW5DZS3_9BACT
MKKPILFFASAASLATTSTLSAATITFSDFNNLGEGSSFTNSVTHNGSGSISNITKSTVDTDNTQFAVSYVAGAETLSFNILVQAFTDGNIQSSISTATNINTGNSGSATIGTTSAAVGTVNTGNGNAFGVGTGMADNSSLVFTITGLTYTGGSASFNGFTGANVQETGGNGHRVVVGEGPSGLFEGGWAAGTPQSITTGGATTLVVSSASQGTQNWGLNDIDFRITTTAVPEPSSSALLLGGLGALALRRRRS